MNFEPYVKQEWEDLPSTNTPIAAERLLHIEQGIKNNSDYLEEIGEDTGNIKDKIVDIEENKAENTTISDIFDIEKSYSVGDYFISDNVLYKVKVACSGVQPPNTTYYEASNVVSALNQGLINLGKGEHILNMICPAYITGSGNYVSFTIPMAVNKEVTSGIISDIGNATIYMSNGVVTKAGITNPTITSVNGTIKVSFGFTSTQTANRVASVLLENTKITLS